MISIYHRNELQFEEEYSVAAKYFNIKTSRCLFEKGELVIPRYSALPFYKELENDCNIVGANLINNYNQHLYVADLFNYYQDLKDFTPKVYENLYELPENGKYVLKGETNSRKFNWNTHMFANSKKDAITVHSRLCEDGLIGSQKIYIRDFVELETFYISDKGLPITREYRFFIYKYTILSGGYYWSSHIDDLQDKNIDIKEVPLSFLNKVISKIQSNFYAPNFYVVDVAKTANGEWIVIELNCGCMSGLSCNDPEVLYSNLKEMLK
jgi:hypothetical protein